MTAPQTDFKKQYKDLYAAKTTPALVNAPELPFLMIDGIGDPDKPVYKAAVEALYSVSYAIRFALKDAGELVYPVMPLQGLWWNPGDFSVEDRDTWHWTMMIMQPPQAAAHLDAAITKAAKKKPESSVDRLRLENFTEGPCAQILHIGPFKDERPAIERLLDFVREQDHRTSGKHHEIYLSDPNRTDPAKLKTIIRYPVTPA